MTDQKAHFRDVSAVLDPESIALVGASIRQDSWPARVFRNLHAYGFQGRVYPVNPKYSELYGVRCYPSVSALPERPDQLIVVVPAAVIPGVLEEAGGLGARSAVIFSGGFAESGTEQGRAAERRVLEAAERYGIRLCGPNCLGNISARSGTVTFAEQTVEDYQPGGFGFVSQSSGVMAGALRYAAQRGVGLSYGVASGNETNTDLADYFSFLVDDPHTQVIGLFIEEVRRPEALAVACRKAAAAGKPVVALKVGRSEEGRAAAAAHTGALAGSREAFDAFCEQLAVIQVSETDAMVEFAELTTRVRRPLGSGLAAVALSGGVRGLLCDVGQELGLLFVELRPETVSGLRSELGPGSAVGNPLDIGWGGLASLDIYLRCLRLLFSDPGVEVLAVQEELPKTEALAERAKGFLAMAEMAGEFGKSLVFYSRGTYMVTDYARQFHSTCSAPFLQGLRRSFEAISRLAQYEVQGREVVPAPAPRASSASASAWRQRLAAAGQLSDEQALRMLEDWGIPVVPWRLAPTPSEAVGAAEALGYPVAVKLSARGLTHKTEVGGVRLGLNERSGVEAASLDLLGRTAQSFQMGGRTLLVQRMAGPGQELLLSCRVDPQYGPLLVLGLGGVWVEALHAVRYALAPLDEARALALIEALPGAALLKGFRGQPPADVPALARSITALSQLAMDLAPELETIEINPYIVGPLGKGGVAVDVVCLSRQLGNRQ